MALLVFGPEGDPVALTSQQTSELDAIGRLVKTEMNCGVIAIPFEERILLDLEGALFGDEYAIIWLELSIDELKKDPTENNLLLANFLKFKLEKKLGQ